MQLAKFYSLVLKFGIERDPRKNKGKIKSYADTAILYGRPDKLINKILVGIDIETPELILADKVRADAGLDLVVTHHPEGSAFAVFYEVMRLQVDLLVKVGLARSVAEGYLEERKREVARKVLPANHMRSVDTARLLDLPFICVHTPADNHAAHFIQALLKREKPRKVKDILAILGQIPEYQGAARDAQGPRVILGNPKGLAGKIFVEMTGGTEGAREIYKKLYDVGIRTLVCMHLSEDHFKKVRDANLNVVIAGHISSDTLGLNLLLDRIEQATQEKLAVVNCSGFRRVKRI